MTQIGFDFLDAREEPEELTAAYDRVFAAIDGLKRSLEPRLPRPTPFTDFLKPFGDGELNENPGP